MTARDPADLFGDFTPAAALNDRDDHAAEGSHQSEYDRQEAAHRFERGTGVSADGDRPQLPDRDGQGRTMASPMPLRDGGGWGVFVPSGEAVEGEVVRVRTKDGKEWDETIVAILGTARNGGQVCKSKRIDRR